MKILFINTNDINGGAAKAAFRIYNCLLKNDVNTKFWVQSKNSNDSHIIGPHSKLERFSALLKPYLDSLLIRLSGGSRSVFSSAWFPNLKYGKINKSFLPDIIHLHWICGGFLRLEQLKKIKKPIVWTLHDEWAFTGGCHIIGTCNNYQLKCGQCPQLKWNWKIDLSSFIFYRKKRAWKELNLTIVTPSRWLGDCAKSSTLFKNNNVEIIHNGLDLEIFKPINKKIARREWNLNPDKLMILFGAMSAVSDYNKGFDLLISALKIIAEKGIESEIIIFGSDKPKKSPDFGLPVHYLGQINDTNILSLLYSAVNVMIVPSRQEAFGQTASESLACGTPVVAFGATGLLDIIDHKENGYLAKPYDIDDLAAGIEWILSDVKRYKDLCINARKKAVESFDINLITKQYINLYNNILKTGE